MDHFLLYLGSLFLFFWGIAHLIATRSVVNGFGNNSLNNKHHNGMDH